MDPRTNQKTPTVEPTSCRVWTDGKLSACQGRGSHRRRCEAGTRVCLEESGPESEAVSSSAALTPLRPCTGSPQRRLPGKSAEDRKGSTAQVTSSAADGSAGSWAPGLAGWELGFSPPLSCVPSAQGRGAGLRACTQHAHTHSMENTRKGPTSHRKYTHVHNIQSSHTAHSHTTCNYTQNTHTHTHNIHQTPCNKYLHTHNIHNDNTHKIYNTTHKQYTLRQNTQKTATQHTTYA